MTRIERLYLKRIALLVALLLALLVGAALALFRTERGEREEDEGRAQPAVTRVLAMPQIPPSAESIARKRRLVGASAPQEGSQS